ncbi:MAG TPA: vitamin K epoxide reductase family protein [Anaerolineales bacterium]|nr:vitamin K epoxide reductase family protein [Anaerolineales bacterium]
MTAAAEKPSKRDWTWMTAVVLAAIGLVDSLYLSYIKLANQTASCAVIGDCATVNNSRFASIGGVPIALLGVAGYLLILVLLVFDRPGRGEHEAIRFALFGVTLAGTLYSIYLTYLEVFVLRAMCPFCVLSALAMTGLFLISLVRLRLWA